MNTQQYQHNMNENEYNNLLNRMNYLSINNSNFNNTNKQFQQQQQQQQQNIIFDSMNDLVMSDNYCETTMFSNGYFSSSIYR
ncbi:hypothetical protein BCR36DRAFT_581256 [Piromyces finnis]|uniref:Uncharacterized protein n=1 Tax=Piromyces finnis TaxID=1754191 RepID=A0A1Y1VHC0_9FUNG|nr:hypothetical protein BCR36DRAFT_581256 [Piromyces finnis]|eukprot:ORX56118.1 hypothetical protein BCR36DRAFT_581256 [Piromyces finnis]